MPKPNGVRYRLDHRYASARLSTYIDGRLEARERERVERHLAVCPPCREEVVSLRQTVSVLRELPPRPLPRSFALPASARAAQARHRRWDVAFGALRTATLVTATLLMLLVSGDALLSAALTGQPVPLIAGEAAPAAVPQSAAPEAPMALAEPPGAEIPAGEEPAGAGESVPGAESFSLQAAPAPADVPLPGEEPPVAAAAPVAEPTAAPPLPEGTPAPEATAPAGDTYLGAAETAMAPPAGAEDTFVPPPAPPGMGGQGGGGYGVGGAGPEAVIPPTSGPEMGVAAAGATGESSGGGAPAEPEPTAPAATEPVAPEPTPDPAAAEPAAAEPAAAEPGAAPDGGGPESTADAAGAAPAPGEGPVAGIAAIPPEPEESAPPATEPVPDRRSVARGMGGAPASPDPTAPADRVAARSPDEGAQEEPGVADTARVYGLEPQQAVGAWQIVRIGAALAFGLLLVLLSGLVWSGYQRRL